MEQYTITDSMLKSIIENAFNSGYHSGFVSKIKPDYVKVDRQEVLDQTFISVKKHDKEVKKFSKELDEYKLWV